ncbi:hypothetical protein [uncultured Mediterranean phage uvMED]|nr:hypothetical protein [uncultured Mediterranean phage uvMED]
MQLKKSKTQTLNNLFDYTENWYQQYFKQIKEPTIKIDNNQIDKGIPNKDIPKVGNNDGWYSFDGYKIFINKVKLFLEDRLDTKIIPNFNLVYYPKNGYMNWHTNSDNPCTRIYLVRAEENPLSEMRFENRIIKDDPLWSFNVFKIEDKTWHCVNALTPRLSLGFHYQGNKSINKIQELINDKS